MEFYVPVDDTPQAVTVGDHDESNEETENLGSKRQCKPLTTFDDQCYIE